MAHHQPPPQLTLAELEQTSAEVRASPLVRRTPMLVEAQRCFPDSAHLLHGARLCLKLESAQNSGTFKIRGAVNQLHRLSKRLPAGVELFTFSSGNYGRAFAMVAAQLQLKCRVLMMTVAPVDRIAVLEALGATVERHEPAAIAERKRQLLAQGLHYCDPFDDIDLVKAYSSVVFEILEDVPAPDIVVVAIGGGGLISGVGATLQIAGHEKTRVYGVEPETANVMSLCFAAGKPVDLPTVKSIASGLCSPLGGAITYPLCREYVNEIVLVTEQEIIDTTIQLANIGLCVEPSGATALAAVLHGRLPEPLEGKQVVVMVSGRNISLAALQQLIDDNGRR